MFSSPPMSTSPEPSSVPRRDDEIVSALSHWLAGHLRNHELVERLRAAGSEGLEPQQAEAVDELLTELERAPEGTRGELEMLARETLEAVALGG